MGTKNKIVYGSRTFNQESIPSGNCYLAASLLSDSLEINTIEFEVESTDRTLTGFVRNTPLTYFYDDEQIGIFYVQKVDRVGPTRYKFYATSAIGLLDETTHYGGVYTGQTAAEVIAGICGKVPYSIKTKFQKTKLYGWLPIATSRENLSQVLFAIGAAVKTDLDGVIRIEGLWDGISGTVDQDRMYAGASVEYSAAVTAVSVTEHQYIKAGESVKLFEGVTQSGDIITFDEPVYNLSATGFTIQASNANYVRVSAGSGTLTGVKYVHNTREITKPVASAETPNVVTVKDATLVSLTNSVAVADRLVNYYRHLEVIDTDAVYRSERPGDRLSIWHPYNETAVSSCLKSVDINMSNKLRAGEKSLVGFVPQQTEEEVTYEKQEIITQSVTWAIPVGVDSIRMVLIGGGSGGSGGQSGSQGNGGQSSSSSRGASSSGSPGTGGKGGTGGSRGLGGKIISYTVEIPKGLESISITVGSGGSGGTGNGGSGQPGKDTSVTVGGKQYSSSEGAISERGYTDIITGNIFALPGQPGQAGGQGGSGGSTDSSGRINSGSSGEAIGTGKGGSGGTGTSATGGSVIRSWRQGDISSTFGTEKVGVVWSGASSATFNSDTGYWTLSGNQTWETAPYAPLAGSLYTMSGHTLNWKYQRASISTGDTWFNVAYHSKTAYPNYGIAWEKGYGGGGGGGAAYNASGSPGGSGAGGRGANGGSGTTPSIMGCGGHGGNGGGGGGGGGGSYIATHEKVTSTETASAQSGGSGGAGGSGGMGASGGVILYYGIRKVLEDGPVSTRDARYLLDAKGRRIVV